MLLLAFLIGCGGEAGDCPECPPCEQAKAAEPAAEALSAFEAELLSEDLVDLRQGVRPFGDRGFGVCTGKDDCDKFLGPNPGELGEGDYIITAELAVPKLGKGWQVEFAMECETTSSEGNSSSSKDAKTYTVSYAGAERGYRLKRLRSIQSPNTSGAKRCDYALTPIRPDGERGEPLKGAFSTPAP
ncbi:MAG: hypothetical protein H6741_23380 [Alphaproteobacteria bacterium]|nr:hypothetical protein [Alphaproteobacteria bacterium]MCB9795651.1 hypothetical protein [Alphaproteobacteria bacterium]